MKRAITALVIATVCGVLALLFLLFTVDSADQDAPGLLERLKSDDQSARLAAIDALGVQGQEIHGAIPALIEQLGDASAVVRAHAAHALGRIGAAAKPAAPALIRLVSDKDKRVRREVVRALCNIRPSPEVVIHLFSKLLREAEPEVRLYAMDAMAREGKTVVPPLIEALGHEEVCYWACLVLAEIGPDAEAAVPALAKLARSDQRPEVRREAVLALAAIGPKAASAVPALIDVVSEDEVNALPGVFALGAIGPPAKTGEVKVRELAEGENVPLILQTLSLWTLARMNPDDDQLVRRAVPRLIDALKSAEPAVRTAAARALIDLDPDPEIVRPLVEKVVADADTEVIEDIMDAVAGLGEDAVPPLIEALEHEEVRGLVAATIARIGPAAKAAVPALIEALSDENPRIRNEVLFAIAAIGPEAKEAVPMVAKLLNDPEMDVRYGACYALGKIGRAAMPAKAELQRTLDSPDQFLAMAGAWALACIHPECQETAAKSVPVLIKALAASDAMSRLRAAEVLGLLGPLARPAAAAVQKALQDEDQRVRETAAQALKGISG